MRGLAIVGMCLWPIGGLVMVVVVECVFGDGRGWEGTVLCTFHHGVYLLPPCCDFLCMGGLNEENKIDKVVNYTVHKDDKSSTCKIFPVKCPSNN